MIEQHPPRNRAERRAVARGRGRRAAGAALTAGSRRGGDDGRCHRVGSGRSRRRYVHGHRRHRRRHRRPGHAQRGDRPGQRRPEFDHRLRRRRRQRLDHRDDAHHHRADDRHRSGFRGATLTGNDDDRIFYIESSASAVTISGLTSADGFAENDSDGGAILSHAALTLRRASSPAVRPTPTVAVSTSTLMGPSRSPTPRSRGTPRMETTVARSPSSPPRAPPSPTARSPATPPTVRRRALHRRPRYPPTISSSTFTENRSGLDPASSRLRGAGGAIFTSGGRCAEHRREHDLRQRRPRPTAAVASPCTPTATAVRSTSNISVVSDNQAMYSGGGLYLYGINSATILRTTISGNTATRIRYRWWGLFVGSAYDGQIVIGESTISGNSGVERRRHVALQLLDGGPLQLDGLGQHRHRRRRRCRHAPVRQRLLRAPEHDHGQPRRERSAASTWPGHRTGRGESPGCARQEGRGPGHEQRRSWRRRRRACPTGASTSRLRGRRREHDLVGQRRRGHRRGAVDAVLGVHPAGHQRRLGHGRRLRRHHPQLHAGAGTAAEQRWTHRDPRAAREAARPSTPASCRCRRSRAASSTSGARASPWVVNGTVDIGAFEVQPDATPTPDPVVITPKFTG